MDEKDQKAIATAYDTTFPKYLKLRKEHMTQCGMVAIDAATQAVVKQFSEKGILRMIDVGCGAGHDMILFPRLVAKNAHHSVKTECVGCDLSTEMISHCRSQGLNVLKGEFSELADQLGRAHLVWAYLSLIHIPIKNLEAYYRLLFKLAVPGGFVGVGFKTGNDEERTDKSDKRMPVDRFTAFVRIDTVRKLLETAGFEKWIVSLEYPHPQDTKYNYGVVIMQRTT